jgi:hypothetical protein
LRLIQAYVVDPANGLCAYGHYDFHRLRAYDTYGGLSAVLYVRCGAPRTLTRESAAGATPSRAKGGSALDHRRLFGPSSGNHHRPRWQDLQVRSGAMEGVASRSHRPPSLNAWAPVIPLDTRGEGGAPAERRWRL